MNQHQVSRLPSFFNVHSVLLCDHSMPRLWVALRPTLSRTYLAYLLLQVSMAERFASKRECIPRSLFQDCAEQAQIAAEGRREKKAFERGENQVR